MQKKRKGFTLVELVIVIAVIAVLSAVLIPTFGSVITNANIAKLQANVNTFNQNLLLRSLTVDGRESYTADEVKNLAEEFGFDRANTPDGYSLWYDRSVNNVVLLKNENAFTTSDPKNASRSSGMLIAYAASKPTVVKGNRPIEAINPYNNNLFYIDGSNEIIENAINQLKKVIQTAESQATSASDICALIENEYDAKARSINAEVKKLSGKNWNYIDLYNSYDIANTIFIGANGMYIPAATKQGTTNITVTNYLVDATITDITNGLNAENAQNINITVDIDIAIPVNVTNVSDSAFATVGNGLINIVVTEQTNVTVSGNSGATIKVTTQKSAIDTDSVTYTNADIVYGRDYECNYPSNCQYVYYQSSGGMKTGALDGSQTLSEVATGSQIKYLVPVFNVLQNENGFCKDFSSFNKVSINSVKSGDLTVYSVIMIRTENGIMKGYKFSNVGYITNVNAYCNESYNVVSHTGKTEAFPKNGAKLTIKLPNNTDKLGNLPDLKVKVTYAPVVNAYTQQVLKDGTVYYAKSSSIQGSEITTALTAFTNNQCEFNVDASGLTVGDYATVSSVVKTVEIYSDSTLVFVKNY